MNDMDRYGSAGHILAGIIDKRKNNRGITTEEADWILRRLRGALDAYRGWHARCTGMTRVGERCMLPSDAPYDIDMDGFVLGQSDRCELHKEPVDHE